MAPPADRADRTRGAARGRRPTAAGRSAGRRPPRSSPCRGTRRRARTIASGRPRATVTTRLMAVVTRLSQSASRTTGEASATCSEPSRIDRHDEGEDGQPEEQREQGGERDERALAPSTRPERGGPRPDPPRPQSPGRTPRDAFDHDAGGRNPSILQDRLAVGTGEPVEEGLGGGRVLRGLDDDAVIGRPARSRRRGRRSS